MTRRRIFEVLPLLVALNSQAADSDLSLTLTVERSELSIGQEIRVHWILVNVSSATVSVVASRDAGGDPQFDELRVSLSREGGAAHPVPLTMPRAAVRIVWRDLAPGEKLDQSFDLASAARRGGITLSPGKYKLDAEYVLRAMPTNTGAPGWSGRTKTRGPLEIVLR